MPEASDRGQHYGHIAAAFDKLRQAGISDQEIFAELHYDLKALAQQLIRHAPAGPSMHATRLVSDLYVRLFGRQAHQFDWASGEHFFYTVSRAMHQLLIDHARRRKANKRGGGRGESLDVLLERDGSDIEFGQISQLLFERKAILALEVDQALNQLRDEHPRLEKVLLLSYYAGMSRQEVGEALGLKPETVKKDLIRARARLRFYLDGTPAT